MGFLSEDKLRAKAGAKLARQAKHKSEVITKWIRRVKARQKSGPGSLACAGKLFCLRRVAFVSAGSVKDDPALPLWEPKTLYGNLRSDLLLILKFIHRRVVFDRHCGNGKRCVLETASAHQKSAHPQINSPSIRTPKIRTSAHQKLHFTPKTHPHTMHA